MSRISKTLVTASMLAMAAVAAPAANAEQGDWVLKAGATMVSPDSNNLKISDDVGVQKLTVGDATSLGLTLTYMMTPNLGVEVLAAVPFKHDIKFSMYGDSLGKIAETKQLPPTVSIQYHFLPDTVFSPYVGAGVNWTMFMSEKISSDIADGLKLEDSFGLAGQVGADFNFGQWLINVDLRYIDISTKAKVKSEGEWLKLGTVSIDPFVYSIMVGYRF